MELIDLEAKLYEGLKDPKTCNDVLHDTHSILGDERSSAAIGASEDVAFKLNSLAAFNKIHSAFGFIGKALDEIEKAKDDPKGNHSSEADLYYADAMREFSVAESCAGKAGYQEFAEKIQEAACTKIPPIMKRDCIAAIFERIDSTLRSEEGSKITELTRLDVLLEQADSIYDGLNVSLGFSIGLREASKKCRFKRRALVSAFYDVLDALLEQGLQRADRIGAIYSGLMKERKDLEEEDVRIPEYSYIDKVKGKVKVLQIETLKRYVRGVIEEDIRLQSEEKGKRKQSLESLYIMGLMHELRRNDATAYMIYSKFLKKYYGDPTRSEEIEARVQNILEHNYKLNNIVAEMKRQSEQLEFSGMEREQGKTSPLRREYFNERDNDKLIGDGVIPYDAALIVRQLLDEEDTDGINIISQEIGELERTNQAAIKRKAQNSMGQKRSYPFEIRISYEDLIPGQLQLSFSSWIAPLIEQAPQRYFEFKHQKPVFTIRHDRKGQMVYNFAA